MSAPVHAPMTQFEVRDDCLRIGDWSLPQLARRVGRTPFYAYERRQIARRIAMLRDILPAGIELHYAMKANPMPALLNLMAGLVDGIDVASGGELKTALDTTMPPERISFAGPGKTDAELGCAVAAGVLINLESEQEMEKVALLGQYQHVRPKVALRINPDFELKHAGMKMGGGPHQFGIDQQRMPAMLLRLGQLGLDFYGFHIFSGSQTCRRRRFAKRSA